MREGAQSLGEMAFSKLKAAPRMGAARTVEALWRLIRKLLKKFAPTTAPDTFAMLGIETEPTHVGTAWYCVYQAIP